MDEMLIFRRNAMLANLCKEWSGMWSACHNDKEKLTELVLMQQSAPFFADFCYRGKGLTKEYCKREFADYINGCIFKDCDGVQGYTYGMYIDAPTGLEMGLDVAQFLWCDNTEITIPQTKATKLYISNKSDIHIVCGGYNNVTVMIFDESKITLEDVDENSNIIIYKYSDKCEVEQGKFCFGKVKEFNKELRL